MSSEHKNAAGWRGIIRAYREQLAVGPETPIVSLHEGNTPLIRVPNFVEAIGGSFDLYLKYEGLNPTASFKDRGMTMALSKAMEAGAKAVMCASTGNTSAYSFVTLGISLTSVPKLGTLCTLNCGLSVGIIFISRTYQLLPSLQQV